MQTLTDLISYYFNFHWEVSGLKTILYAFTLSFVLHSFFYFGKILEKEGSEEKYSYYRKHKKMGKRFSLIEKIGFSNRFIAIGVFFIFLLNFNNVAYGESNMIYVDGALCLSILFGRDFIGYLMKRSERKKTEPIKV